MARRISTHTTLLLALSALASCSAPDVPQARESVAEAARYAPQNRPDVRGTMGAVSAGHPLAAQAGLRVLHDGGTATDAIIAMAGVLAVVRPHMNGVGGDAFGIFYNGQTGEVTALNGSGRSGALATPSFFTAAGVDAIPQRGAMAVSVPGAVAALVDAHARFGSIPCMCIDPSGDGTWHTHGHGTPLWDRVDAGRRERARVTRPRDAPA